nr:hypothetical protein [Burkholderia sp. Leaf177]
MEEGFPMAIYVSFRVAPSIWLEPNIFGCDGALMTSASPETAPATLSAITTVLALSCALASSAMAAPAPAKLIPPTAICVRMAVERAFFARLLLLRPVASSETATHVPVDSFQTDLYDLFML